MYNVIIICNVARLDRIHYRLPSTSYGWLNVDFFRMSKIISSPRLANSRFIMNDYKTAAKKIYINVGVGVKLIRVKTR